MLAPMFIDDKDAEHIPAVLLYGQLNGSTAAGLKAEI